MNLKQLPLRHFWVILLCIGTFVTYVSARTTEQSQTVVVNSEAESSGLKIHYKFDDVTNRTVVDASGSGYNGTLMNNASILSMGKYKVLSLGNGTGYLDMGKAAGEVIPSMKNYTISVYCRVDKDASLDGTGYFLWAFSTLQSNTSTAGTYMAYRLNAQRFAVASAGYNNEKAIEIGGNATKNIWQHILYRQNGTTGELYINGKPAGKNTAMPVLNNTFTTSPSYNWIGRAPFSNDNYLRNTLVYDFRLYDQVARSEEIAELAAVVDDLNHEYNYGTIGDFTRLSQQVTLCNTALENAGNYPQTAVEEFKDAVSLAQEIIDAQKASQFLIDESLSELQTAYNKFKKAEGFKFDTSSVRQGYDTERGFKHPGALHTQEDFDRIKALLEANDPTTVAAYNKLKANGYSQSTAVSFPVEFIVRGGGVGENYMNAARGAAMAYQNALRWKISGDKANADRAVSILNDWARICKAVGGDTNQSLASGLYGYQFANAAELMRDYEGWNPADFKKFQKWILDIWYPRCIDFLRRRHGTWQNGTPGHYWSNWGLCNALAVMSFGILCDDVFIYNQGVSFYKYDQVGNFTDNRTPPIDNSGLTEFIGNLVPVMHADDRGPFGYLAQMQESGRDQGHALMALGLVADICQIGWNQGDDLFALMDNRLVAGIEYVAAYNSDVENLPWSEYWYHDVRTAIHNSWKMTGNNGGGRGAFRPYWDRILGHYEGVKGMTLNYSHKMKNKQSIDDGGGSYGQSSGGFDHLGFTTLTCARPAVTPDRAPTLITPTLRYRGLTYKQNDLGGLKNLYEGNTTSAMPTGNPVTLIPQLPKGVTDTGNWLWNTGDTTKDLKVTTDSSKVYRVTYTNEKGVKSTQLFSIAVKGDCLPENLVPAITVDGVTVNDTVITVMARTPLTLAAWNNTGWGSHRWSNGETSSSITVDNINSNRTYSVIYTNQGGRETLMNFHINVISIAPSLSVDGGEAQNTGTVVVKAGQSVELIPIIAKKGGVWEWSNGATTKNLLLENVQSTGRYSVTYTIGEDEKYTLDFMVYLAVSNKVLADGDYHIKNISEGTYLTNIGTMIPMFEEKTTEETNESQIWHIAKDGMRYKITSLPDNRFLNEYGQFTNSTYYSSWNTYILYGVEDGDLYAIRNGGSAGTNYWTINTSGSIDGKGTGTLTGYPFEIVPAKTVGMDNAQVNSIRVYPNPVQDCLIVRLDEDNAENVIFSLFSVSGVTVKTVPCVAGENAVQVNDLSGGLYIGVLNTNGQSKTFKIIKK